MSNNGTLVDARFFNFGSQSVNGVTFQFGYGTSSTFTLSGFTGGSNVSSSSSPYASLSSSYQTLLSFQALTSGSVSLTMSGLTAGHQYEFEWWSDQSNTSSSSSTTATDGSGVTLQSNTSSAVGGTGQFAVGTFTAGSSSEVISFTGAIIINAFQLRDVTPAGPGVTTSGGSAAYTEGGPAVAVDGGVAVSDPSSTTLASATVSISSNFQSGDALNFTNTGSITGSYDAGTGTLTLSGTDTLANYQAALQSITFWTTSTSTAARTVSFTVTDGTNSSAPATRNVTVSPRGTLTVMAVTNTKTYDGGTSAAATPTVSGSLAAGDTETAGETYAGRNVGSGLTLTPTIDIKNSSGQDVTADYTIYTVDNTTGVIHQAPLTITAATNSKSYDGTTSAAATPTVSGLQGTDSVAGLAEAYTDANGGTGKALTVTAYALNDGNSGNNYTVSTVNNTTGVISRRAITVTAATNTKTYDGTTSASATPTLTSGALAGGDTATYGEAYAGKNAGTGLTLTPTADISNSSNQDVTADYSITYASNTGGVINPRPITVTAQTNTKTYDGTTSAAATPTITSGTLADGDTADFWETYAGKNVGTGLTLAPGGSVNDGNGGENYAVTFANNTTGVITKRTLTVTATAQNKVYDGTTAATVTFSDNRASGDKLTIDDTATFSDKNVGNGKTVTVSGMSISGADAGNYALASTTAAALANITPRALTIRADSLSKAFGAALALAGADFTASGLVPGDHVAWVRLGSAGAPAAAAPGQYRIQVSAARGTGLGNYTITYVPGLLTVLRPPPRGRSW